MNLKTIIEQLDRTKRDLIASGLKATSEGTKKRELKAALELHRIGIKLDRVLQSLVPFDIDQITTEPDPKQLPLFKAESEPKRTGGEPQTSKGKKDADPDADLWDTNGKPILQSCG